VTKIYTVAVRSNTPEGIPWSLYRNQRHSPLLLLLLLLVVVLQINIMRHKSLKKLRHHLIIKRIYDNMIILY